MPRYGLSGTIDDVLNSGIPVNVTTQVNGVDDILNALDHFEKVVILGGVLALGYFVWKHWR